MCACLKMSKVHGILFDFDNTFVDTRIADEFASERAKEKLLEHFLEVDVESMTSEYKRLVRENGVDPAGAMNPHSWRIGLWQRVLNMFSNPEKGGEVKAGDIYETWRSSRVEKMRISDEVSSLLVNLRQMYRVAVVTNSDPVIQKQKLAACQIERFFDVIVISGEQPYPKPHASIFHTACSMLSVAPHECIMIGDSLEHDIQGGINAGLLATVWVKMAGRELKNYDPQPDYTVNSLTELPRVLSKLNS